MTHIPPTTTTDAPGYLDAGPRGALLTETAAALYCGVEPPIIRNNRRLGRIPAQKAGARLYLYRPADLDQWREGYTPRERATRHEPVRDIAKLHALTGGVIWAGPSGRMYPTPAARKRLGLLSEAWSVHAEKQGGRLTDSRQSAGNVNAWTEEALDEFATEWLQPVTVTPRVRVVSRRAGR